SFLTAIELDVVTETHLAGDGHIETGEQVGESILERQRDRQAANAEGREDGCDRIAELVEDEQYPKDEDGKLRERLDERGNRECSGNLAPVGTDEVTPEPHAHQGERENEQRDQSLAAPLRV